MKRGIITFLSCIVFQNAVFAQESDTLDFVLAYDNVDQTWHGLSETIETYDGFKSYCVDKAYQQKVLDNLQDIHHYDSLIIDKINDTSYTMGEKERTIALKEISKMESVYNIKSFVVTLQKECKERAAIEHDRKATKGDGGEDSYESQKYMLEIELGKYVNHVTKLADHIDRHVHHLNKKY